MTLPDQGVLSDQRTFFALLEEFFRRATGYTREEFAKLGRFDEVIRANAERIGKRGDAFAWIDSQLRPYYGQQANASYGVAKALGGMKLVLGGGSIFAATQLAAVRKMALYADTILLPDPVLPWFEDARSEERFRHARLLENVFFLLHLKPLVDADLPYPAVMVFPSWERSLEAHDPVTQQRDIALYAAFMSNYLGATFRDLPEVMAFARSNQAEFLKAVERARLFVAPGGSIAETLEAAVVRYKAELKQWRTPAYLHSIEGMSDAELVALGIAERLGPQYHLLENADEFGSQPMLCLDAHWAYHTMIARMQEGRLEHAGALGPQTVATLRALNQPSVSWLGNVPIDALVDLRKDNENESFRKKLAEYTNALHESQLGDLDRVAGEVARGLASLLAVHGKEVREIEGRYKSRHLKTLAAGWITLGAALMPTLAPFVGGPVAPAAIAVKYIANKVEEQREKSQAAHTLMGVLAKAQGR
jgi:hypothetical protein